jgi:hypothetical protein
MSVTSFGLSLCTLALNFANDKVRRRSGKPDVGPDAYSEIGSQRYDAIDRRIEIERFDSNGVIAREKRTVSLVIVQNFPSGVSEDGNVIHHSRDADGLRVFGIDIEGYSAIGQKLSHRLFAKRRR